ncbi:hypothetical protein NE237_009678 [Protea cynaroides]|uniref:Uncharacterized protein n=1 Tax=Protea cynaroides TaxID=273540 RepID=A0A9Q0R0I5_9MAGN|nr:hypothetical protein NE237_009678 [Protea cynaroides]
MGRKPCCSKEEGLNRGGWSSLEDKVLTDYIRVNGEGKWRHLPKKAGLKRCGKSCRLRWLNYLRPGIKRGNITQDEEELIVRLHKLLGNRWSLIAGRLPGRTDNEIKNYWNTTLSKKLNHSWGLNHSNISEGKKKKRRKNKSSNNNKKKKTRLDTETLQTETPSTQIMELQEEEEKKKPTITLPLSIAEQSMTQIMESHVVKPMASRGNKVLLPSRPHLDEHHLDIRATLEPFMAVKSDLYDNEASSFKFNLGEVNHSDLMMDLNQGDLSLADRSSDFFELFDFHNGEGGDCDNGGNSNGSSLMASTEQPLFYHDEFLEELFGP